jgi:hypothetical protein
MPATTPRDGAYIYVTWITGLLAADDQCRWAAWFRAHFKHTKIERGDGTLTKWKAEHGEMLDAIAGELTADGWHIFLESQNKFTLEGQSATLGGCPDIVAVRGTDVRVIDAKTGKRRDKDFWQVCTYLMVLPLTHGACKGKRLVGEIRYRDHTLLIQPEEFTPDLRLRISNQIRETGAAMAPARVPSYRECLFCDIGPTDCPDRIEKATKTEVEHALF